MRVGFDAKKAMRNHTGIGNYSRRCIRAVEETGTQVRSSSILRLQTDTVTYFSCMMELEPSALSSSIRLYSRR